MALLPMAVKNRNRRIDFQRRDVSSNQVKRSDTPDFTPPNPTGKEEVKEGLLQIVEKMQEIEKAL